MLVKALCLRHLGRRLSADELRAEMPLMGRLQFDSDPHGRGGRVLLMPLAGSTNPAAELHEARLRKIDRRGLLFQGTGRVFQRRQATDYRQALFAWPIDEDDLHPTSPDPIDQDEHAQDMADAMR